MQSMRHILRDSLGRSLAAMPELERLQAAWPIACGRALSTRATVTQLAAGVLTIQVHDEQWLDQMRSMRAVLTAELGKIAQVRLTGIHFEGAPHNTAASRRATRKEAPAP